MSLLQCLYIRRTQVPLGLTFLLPSSHQALPRAERRQATECRARPGARVCSATRTMSSSPVCDRPTWKGPTPPVWEGLRSLQHQGNFLLNVLAILKLALRGLAQHASLMSFEKQKLNKGAWDHGDTPELLVRPAPAQSDSLPPSLLDLTSAKYVFEPFWICFLSVL